MTLVWQKRPSKANSNCANISEIVGNPKSTEKKIGLSPHGSVRAHW
jgi:hypothetical protein